MRVWAEGRDRGSSNARGLAVWLGCCTEVDGFQHQSAQVRETRKAGCAKRRRESTFSLSHVVPTPLGQSITEEEIPWESPTAVLNHAPLSSELPVLSLTDD